MKIRLYSLFSIAIVSFVTLQAAETDRYGVTSTQPDDNTKHTIATYLQAEKIKEEIKQAEKAKKAAITEQENKVKAAVKTANQKNLNQLLLESSQALGNPRVTRWEVLAICNTLNAREDIKYDSDIRKSSAGMSDRLCFDCDQCGDITRHTCIFSLCFIPCIPCCIKCPSQETIQEEADRLKQNINKELAERIDHPEFYREDLDIQVKHQTIKPYSGSAASVPSHGLVRSEDDLYGIIPEIDNL